MDRYPWISGTTISIEKTTTTTTTSTSTTTRTIETTSSKSHVERKRTRVCKNSEGNYFGNKRFKTVPDSCCGEYSVDSKSIDQGSISSCLKQQFNYTVEDSNNIAFSVCSSIHAEQKKKIMNEQECYGYITYSGPRKTLKEEYVSLTKVVNLLQTSDYCSESAF